MGTGPTPRAIERWLRARLPALLARRRVTAAYVFGSWARGEADADSDVDLIVVTPSRRPFVERFKDFPEIIDAPAGVDLLVYTPEEFAEQRRVNRFVRHVMHEAVQIV